MGRSNQLTWKRVRKAVAAGVGAAVSTVLGAVASGDQLDERTVGAAVAAGIVVGWGVWRVPNAPEHK